MHNFLFISGTGIGLNYSMFEFLHLPDFYKLYLKFVAGMLSRASFLQLTQSMAKLAKEFDELSKADSELPLDERFGCSAVFAVRRWEPSIFTKLRR